MLSDKTSSVLTRDFRWRAIFAIAFAVAVVSRSLTGARARFSVISMPARERVAPNSTQLGMVSGLGATATWNRFGTPASLIKDGGYFATGLKRPGCRHGRTKLDQREQSALQTLFDRWLKGDQRCTACAKRRIRRQFPTAVRQPTGCGRRSPDRWPRWQRRERLENRVCILVGNRGRNGNGREAAIGPGCMDEGGSQCRTARCRYQQHQGRP